MNPKKLEESYQKNKILFHSYLDNIKKNSPWDLYTVINTTLIKNPYATQFPLNFFSHKKEKYNRYTLFIKNSFNFYLRQSYLLFSYFIAFVIYKIVYKKRRKNELNIVVDTFALVDNTIKDNKFNEKYFTGIYEIFEKYNAQYVILLRLYNVGKNPFKLIKFFKIINDDPKEFIFEYELLTFFDFLILFKLILLYPFKTLRLLQKEEKAIDVIFNKALLDDIKQQSFDAFTRYILGRNLAKIDTISKIYSWSEFQVIERSFNYAIRKTNKHIELSACQFYLNYETYFNAYVDDVDFEMNSSAHNVFVNGKYYVKDRKKVKYAVGVSLRYNDIFKFKEIEESKKILILGSYIEKDTRYMLESVSEYKEVLFKNHPAVNIDTFAILPLNIKVTNDNIYKLFEDAQVVMGTASGTCVEAVACGVSVIIIASQDNLTANPLVDYGQGKIWDIAFTKNDIKKVYNKLMEYRKNNLDEIEKISSWYKDNFFIEPDEENIVNVFELNVKEKNR